jgi:glycosyltransferase involved in cell wall biosynthesis
MKVAIIHSHLNGRGGSQRYVIEIARALAKLGVCVEIFSYVYNKNLCYPELTEGLKIHTLLSQEENNFSGSKSNEKRGAVKAVLKLIYNVGVVRKLCIMFGVDYLFSMLDARKISQNISNAIVQSSVSGEYDIVFAHEEPISVWAAIMYKKHSGIPVYWFCYDTIEKWFLEWTDEFENSKLRNLLLRNVYFLYDRMLVRKYVDMIAVLDSTMESRVLKLYGVKPVVRRGGLPQEVFNYNRGSYLRQKYNVDSTRVIIFCLTRFAPYRRVHDIFELFESLPKNIKSKVFFYINAPITDAIYYNDCKLRYSDLFCNENIVIENSYPRNDREMYQMYLSSDIFIFPNENQTWGHAPLEAMGCGVTTLVSNGCGISEVINKTTPETVFETGNIEELTKKLENVMQNREYEHISKKQKKYVEENLTWKKICEIYIKDFYEILGYKNNV